MRGVRTIVLCAALLCLGAGDRRQDLMQKAQQELWIWNVAGAREASQELLRLDPQSDTSFYLVGVVAFYEGDYAKAKSWFDRVKDMTAFEQGNDGMKSLADAVLKENVTFRESRSPAAIVHVQPGLDEVMVDYIHQSMGVIRKEIGEELGLNPKEAVLVEIYPNAASFIAASPLTESDVKTSGTIALCKYGRILVTTPRSLLRGYPWLDTLSHEYVHYLLTRRWGSNIPVWLHEGIAKYLEMRWRVGKAGYLAPSYEDLLAEALRKKDFVTFEEMHPSFAKLPSARRAQLAYAQVQTLVEYIVKERGGWEKIHAILDEMAKGRTDEQAMSKVLGQPLQATLAAWKVWLAKKNLKERDLDTQTLSVVDHPTTEAEADRLELSRLESPGVREFLHLGDLLRQRGRMKAASMEYEKAQGLAKTPSPIIATKLGQTYLGIKDYARAQSVLEQTVALYPDQGLSWQLLGDVYREKKESAKAASAYERAVHVNPFNPQIHAYLARLYEDLNDDAAVRRERKAMEILVGKQSR